MSINKRVKEGGTYYKGSILSVASTPGDYAAFLSVSSGGSALNSLAIVPSSAGSGDYVTVQHVKGTAGSTVIATLAENLYNMGAGVPINLDFICLEKVLAGNSIKVTYTNVATIGMSVVFILERGR